jgi:enediyne biosynthesis protein E3
MTAIPETASAGTVFRNRLRTAIARRFLALSPDEAKFTRRGFDVADPARQSAMEGIGETFIRGYNAALSVDSPADVLSLVLAMPPHRRGFAAEGAAMGFAVADALPFTDPRLGEYLKAAEANFSYLTHVGVGWAMARLPWRRRALSAQLDPLLRWLAFDGMGFHDTYFDFARVRAFWQRQDAGYAARAYDQGVGRALWFVSGGAHDRAARLIADFPSKRRGDLWSGLGLAMTYAGPVDARDIGAVCRASQGFAGHFAQGAAFACEAHALAREIPPHTETVARQLTGRGAVALSALVRTMRARLPAAEDADVPRYETWRRNVAAAMAALLEQRS